MQSLVFDEFGSADVLYLRERATPRQGKATFSLKSPLPGLTLPMSTDDRGAIPCRRRPLDSGL
jgi:hypothetical protein